VLAFTRACGILDYASDFGNTSFVSGKENGDFFKGRNALTECVA
jgi:hypothetical protein